MKIYKGHDCSPVLICQEFFKPFIIQADAFGKGIGAIIQQDGHPNAYYSKKLCSKLQNSTTYVQQFDAITSAIQNGDTTYRK